MVDLTCVQDPISIEFLRILLELNTFIFILLLIEVQPVQCHFIIRGFCCHSMLYQKTISSVSKMTNAYVVQYLVWGWTLE